MPVLGREKEPFWGDMLLIAAAVVAGTPVVKEAVSALMTRVIGIDLVVSVAAIGAILVRNYREAAAVTFDFRRVGDQCLVPAGARHNFCNTGEEPLVLYTVCSPPEHPADTVLPT